MEKKEDERNLNVDTLRRLAELNCNEWVNEWVLENQDSYFILMDCVIRLVGLTSLRLCNFHAAFSRYAELICSPWMVQDWKAIIHLTNRCETNWVIRNCVCLSAIAHRREDILHNLIQKHSHLIPEHRVLLLNQFLNNTTNCDSGQLRSAVDTNKIKPNILEG